MLSNFMQSIFRNTNFSKRLINTQNNMNFTSDHTQKKAKICGKESLQSQHVHYVLR